MGECVWQGIMVRIGVKMRDNLSLICENGNHKKGRLVFNQVRKLGFRKGIQDRTGHNRKIGEEA